MFQRSILFSIKKFSLAFPLFYFNNLHLKIFYVITTQKVQLHQITEMKKNKSLPAISTSGIFYAVLSLFSTPKELVLIHMRRPFVTRR